MASCRQGRHQACNQSSTTFRLKNFFRAPRHGRLGSPWNIPTDIGCVLGGRSGCQNFRASFQGFSKNSKRRTQAYRMHVGTDFLKLPPVTGQYWSLFQCSVLGTGGTCAVKAPPQLWEGNHEPSVTKAQCRGTDRKTGRSGCKGTDTPCHGGRLSRLHCHGASGQPAECASRRLK